MIEYCLTVYDNSFRGGECGSDFSREYIDSRRHIVLSLGRVGVVPDLSPNNYLGRYVTLRYGGESGNRDSAEFLESISVLFREDLEKCLQDLELLSFGSRLKKLKFIREFVKRFRASVQAAFSEAEGVFIQVGELDIRVDSIEGL